MQAHNFKNFSISWLGIDVKSGLDAGMSASMARTGPRHTFKPTGNGKQIRIRQTDDSGVLTCTVDYSSPLNTLLMAQLELESVGMLTIYDGNTKRRWYLLNATLVTDPDFSFGVDTSPVTWMWFYEKADYQPGANDLTANVIGA